MKTFVLVLAAGWLAVASVRAATEGQTNAAPRVADGDALRIVKILKEHYVDRDRLSEKMLDQASLSGILEAVGQGAVLLPASTAGATPTSLTNQTATTRSIARAEIIKPNIGYIRFGNVNADVVADLDARLQEFTSAKVTGFILDLRFADGKDFAAAAAAAGRFLEDGKELFMLKSTAHGEQVFRASGNAKGPNTGEQLGEAPVLLLVNSQTRGSAEAFAGGLRALDRGILIGSLTAGEAVAYEDVKLDENHILRVATAKIVLRPTDPKNLATAELFPNGLAPDIYVPLQLSVEREMVLHLTTNVTLTVSLQPTLAKKRFSEAELVKAFRGEAVESATPPAAAETNEEEMQEPRDTVLQRAVDIMKGIRMLLSWR